MRPRTRILHEPVEPAHHLEERVLDGLARDIPVRLVRQDDVADVSAGPLDRVEKPLALHGEGAWIVVRLAVDQEEWLLDSVGIHEGRKLRVDVPRFPKRSPLTLESKRRQGA